MRGVIMCLMLGVAYSSTDVRPSVLAGAWYPASAAELRRTVESLMRQSGQKPDPGLVALVAPHAGYQYSARTAAHAYATIPKGKFTKVMILAPSHHAWIRGAAVGPFGAYETPLGRVRVDTQACARLLADPLVSQHRDAEAAEHAIEIHLPFLQVALEDFSLIPVLVGTLSSSQRASLAKLLRTVVDEKTLLVASSDFTHYGDRFGYVPFRAATVSELKAKLSAINHEAANLVCRKDVTGFEAYVMRTKDTICGREPIAVLLEMLPAEAQGRLLHYSTSLDVIPETDSAVSYLALAFSTPDSAPKPSFSLPLEDRKALVLLAREVVKRGVEGKPGPNLKEWESRMSEAARQRAGVFVTLTKGGQLRGCIGYIEGIKPLVEAVADNAYSAAFRDPRFMPVTKEEFPQLSFKISVLTPLEPVRDIEEIQVGTHGLVLSSRGHRGVFLPEVPVEQGWDRLQYLEHLGLKAGLDRHAWKTATLEKFESIVFGDELLDRQ